jgi:hypothetical protein
MKESCLCLLYFFERIKRELNKRLICECRCDERLKVKVERSTHLGYTVLCGGLEHLKMKTMLMWWLLLSYCIIPYPQSPTHCIVVYVYISRISMVGSVGFVPSGTSGDNWTTSTVAYPGPCPHDMPPSLESYVHASPPRTMSPWHVFLSRGVCPHYPVPQFYTYRWNLMLLKMLHTHEFSNNLSIDYWPVNDYSQHNPRHHESSTIPRRHTRSFWC